MKTTTPTTTTKTPAAEAPSRPALTMYHPNPRGTGSAVKMELYPATLTAEGCIFLTIAAQKANTPSGDVFPAFDWVNAISARLMINDLALFLRVFCGWEESILDGKGIFHRTTTAALVLKLTHRIEPLPAYVLEVSRKAHDKPEVQKIVFAFTYSEALALSRAIEQSLGVIAFGVPAV